MLDVKTLMARLAIVRPLFHSERDFQHAVGWVIQQQIPSASLFFERPFRTDGSSIHLDILVKTADSMLAIELKYKTAHLQVQIGEEEYHLSSQSARDHGRYDFLKDLTRLERIVARSENCRGLAILLSNDAHYWKGKTRVGTNDAEFHFPDNRSLPATLRWGLGASANTMKNREAPIFLEGEYLALWQSYSQLAGVKNGEFKYLGLEVHPKKPLIA